jgi:hypothetical protein
VTVERKLYKFVDRHPRKNKKPPRDSRGAKKILKAGLSTTFNNFDSSQRSIKFFASAAGKFEKKIKNKGEGMNEGGTREEQERQKGGTRKEGGGGGKKRTMMNAGAFLSSKIFVT